ncbi:MAG TPA: TerC family protein [Acidimicrobiales bacterium]|jgi:tellurite resistance protein TerC|nr:TerC family protein [Acidimicrobiales bacterium]
MYLLAESTGRDNFVSIDVPPWAWAALVAFILFLLLVDLFVVNKEAHEIKTREAAIASTIWIGIGLAFALVVWWAWGGAATGEYLAAYLIEKSLSVDNVFVWALIFSYFAVPAKYQHRVLFWGIFGALVLRAIFIFAGVALIERFEFVLYIFGAFLLFTAVRLLFRHEEEIHPERNVFLRLVRKVVPTTNHLDGQKLFTRENGKRFATPLFAVLVLVEATDVVFAVDSVPAVLAVSREQFIVFASNAFAILGLRALYFLLAHLHGRFEYLQQGLAIILAYVGVKMLIVRWYHIPTWVSLSVITVVLTVAILASLRVERRRAEEEAAGGAALAPGGDAGAEGGNAVPDDEPAAVFEDKAARRDH